MTASSSRRRRAAQRRGNSRMPIRPNRRLDWQSIVEASAAFVRSFDSPVTLRQCFYRLVVIGMLLNTRAAYKGLSRYTAIARREGWHPDFIDNTRRIHVVRHWDSTADARQYLAAVYRRDRTEGQQWT